MRRMAKVIAGVVLGLSLAAALFSAYSVFYFWTLQDISAPAQLRRVHYDIFCWLGIFVLSMIVSLIGLRVARRRKR